VGRTRATENREGEIIIECGIEGGSLTLLGTRVANGWRFRTVSDESTFYHILNEEDRPAEYRQEDWVHDSDWVDSWEAALALLDRNPWHLFYPLQVHPDFKQQTWAAVQKRCDADERHKGDAWTPRNLETWRRRCYGEEIRK
jgi:hypothetical protein